MGKRSGRVRLEEELEDFEDDTAAEGEDENDDPCLADGTCVSFLARAEVGRATHFGLFAFGEFGVGGALLGGLSHCG